MDFNKLDSVTAAKTGAELHICHPASGLPLYDNSKDATVDNGKPCIVVVMGEEAPEVRAAMRAWHKENARSEDADTEDMFIDDLHDRLVAQAAPRIIGFKNIKNGQKAATAEDAAWFLNLNRFNTQDGEKSFVEQVLEFSNKRASYLGNGSTA
jgi:hypothetical protein